MPQSRPKLSYPVSPEIRNDIQFLRALAVILVLFYHAKIPSFDLGYLGVDIFFVISGFLITNLILKDIDKGQFSLAEFFMRRARRLFPAAALVVFFTTIASAFLLSGSEFKDYIFQSIGSLTFTANLFLIPQAHYFGGFAGLKPLLHMWTLGIEAQFYLVLPFLLLFIPRKYLLLTTMVFIAISFVACLELMEIRPNWAFYLMPTRAWEFGIGALASLIHLSGKSQKIFSWVGIGAMAVLFLIFTPLIPLSGSHPGWPALMVCMLTFVVILGRLQFFNSPLALPALKIGDISYSLYLVHWPLFAFLNNAYLATEIPLWIRVTALVISLFGAMLLYILVEVPFRRLSFSHYQLYWKRYALFSIVAFLLPVIIFPFLRGNLDYAELRRVNFGISKECATQTGAFNPAPACQTSENPRILVWGDSYAMHLVPGIIEKFEDVAQATRSACGPFLGLAPLMSPSMPETWSKECIDFNDSVIAYIEQTPSIEIVILSSPFMFHASRENRGLERSSEGYSAVSMGPVTATNAMARTVEKIQAAGKKMVLVSAPPGNGYDAGVCVERDQTGKVILGGYKGCPMSLAAYEKKDAEVEEFFKALQNEKNVSVIKLSDFLCEGDVCKTEINGNPVYRDGGHLTYYSSIYLTTQTRFGTVLLEGAR